MPEAPAPDPLLHAVLAGLASLVRDRKHRRAEKRARQQALAA